MGMGINVSFDGDKLLQEVKDNIIPSGCQTQLVIINKTDRQLELGGSEIAAGTVLTTKQDDGKLFAWAPPRSIEAGQTAVILIDSTGWSSQVCTLYGLPIEHGMYHLLMFYAYNPKDDVDMFAGLRNPVRQQKAISKADFRKTQSNSGSYPAQTLCAEANEGTGPDWQKNVTNNPTHTFYTAGLKISLDAMRYDKDGSRNISKFTLEDAE